MKLSSLRQRHWVLTGRGEFVQADSLSYEITRYEDLIEEIETTRGPRNPEDTAAEDPRNPVR